MKRDELDAVFAVHDDLIARRGVDVWVAAAPAFTRADAPAAVAIPIAACASSASFAARVRDAWTAARADGLSAARHLANGDATDSGGGARLALAGETPDASPFVRYPHVLPALVRYLNNHPALSYWFASACVGSGSDGPRPDEGIRERYDELELALERLEARADGHRVRPAELWRALAPLLVDAAGDPARAECDARALCETGAIQLRAIRTPEQPEMLAALAALLRALVARLAIADYRAPLVDWHDELHDRFALPAALALDLRHVLGDLDDHGFGLPLPLRRELDAWRAPGLACKLGDATLRVRPALEFSPLVDSSTERCELSIDGPGPDRVVVAGRWAQLRALAGGVRALGIRRRVHTPGPGLVPHDPLVIEWSHAGRAQRLELHASRPTGDAYAGLPATADDALLRRNERIRIVTRDGDASASSAWPATTPFTLDLRRHG